MPAQVDVALSTLSVQVESMPVHTALSASAQLALCVLWVDYSALRSRTFAQRLLIKAHVLVLALLPRSLKPLQAWVVRHQSR